MSTLYNRFSPGCQLGISPLSQRLAHHPSILAQPVSNRLFGQRFELYSWDGNTRYAGQYSPMELAYLVGRFPRGSSPTVAAFMAVAESMIRGGLARGAAV